MNIVRAQNIEYEVEQRPGGLSRVRRIPSGIRFWTETNPTPLKDRQSRPYRGQFPSFAPTPSGHAATQRKPDRSPVAVIYTS